MGHYLERYWVTETLLSWIFFFFSCNLSFFRRCLRDVGHWRFYKNLSFVFANSMARLYLFIYLIWLLLICRYYIFFYFIAFDKIDINIINVYLVRKFCNFRRYPSFNWVNKGNLEFRHSVPYFLPNFREIVCWVAE